MHYVIIGGGIAGVTAARTIREQDKSSKISIFTNEFHPLGLYARKDMARRLAIDVVTADELLLAAPADLSEDNIKFIYKDVLRVFSRLNQILLPHHMRNTYDRLLIASGATPRIIDAPGTHFIGVHQVRSYEDISMIEAWMPELQQKGAVIIGGGILALDMIYALNQRGVPVTMVVHEAQVASPLLSAQASAIIEKRLHTAGIRLMLNTELSEYVSEDDKMLDAVRLSDGQVIPTRAAICAIGVRPTTSFLDESGIEIDDHSGVIPVNSFLQTNVENIFAAGNCAQVGAFTARNWQQSAVQGRIAALNMLGEKTAFATDLAGDLDTQLYDLPLAYFGQSDAMMHWVYAEGENFAQVSLEDEHITGAVLLGEPVGIAPMLLKRAQSKMPTRQRDLETLLTPLITAR